MKKAHALLASTLLLGTLATACSSGGGETQSTTPSSGGSTPAASGATKLQFWTFNELHQKYFESMAKAWNTANPNEQIQLQASTLPFDDMHNKLLVALQSGTGAPDISDIEITKFPNYLKGTPQLAELNSVVEPELKNIVKSRVDIYSKGGKYYGIDYHIGASVIYYNKEMLDKAGVNPDSITTWDEFYEAGKKVVAATGKPMISFEATDPFSFWPMVAQQGSDFTDKDGKVILDNEKNIATLTYMQKLVKEKIAVVAPGGFHHAEEYYGFMNKGGAASVAMPMWYMGRFTDYMPDLKGKLVIKPMPAWEKGGNRSVGMGGTGTAVMAQSKNKDLAVKFLAFAKLSKEGNIQIWQQLGFDPIRTEVWEAPELKADNKFTQYFGKDIFDVLVSIKNEIGPININEKTPEVIDEVKKTVLFKVLNEGADPAATLKESAAVLK